MSGDKRVTIHDHDNDVDLSISTTGGARVAVEDSGGGIIDPATHDAQTDGSHKTQVIDFSGNAQGAVLHDLLYWMLTCNLPVGYVIATGDLANHSAHRTFGFNSDIGTNLEDITETGESIIPLPTSSITMEVISSSANDAGTVVSSGTSTGGSSTILIDTGATFISDGVAANDIVLNDTDVESGIVVSIDSEIQLTILPTNGVTFALKAYRVVTPASTGVSVVEVHGLDNNFNDLDEFVVTNGLAGVSTVKQYRRINNFHAMAVGSNGVSVGNIDIQDVGGGSIYNRIGTGGNMTLQCHYTVPSSKTAYLTQWRASSSGAKPIRFILRATADFDDRGLIPGVFHFQDILIANNGGENSEFIFPLPFPGKCDIKISGNALGASGGVGACSFGLWLEDS